MGERVDGFLTDIKRVYFLGIGGIGMSALARYFLYLRKEVSGYDLHETPLTRALVQEGCSVHYEDSIAAIGEEFLTPSFETLVIYTPALPAGHNELNHFKSLGRRLFKRAEVLGEISRAYRTVALAGTHGKTTTSALVAHILSNTVGCDALIGGVSKNFGSNLLLADRGARYLVVEADEYDNSFQHLWPEVAAVTSVSMDHMDFFHSFNELQGAFRSFARQSRCESLMVSSRAAEHFSGVGKRLVLSGLESGLNYSAESVCYSGTGMSFVLRRRGKEPLSVELGIPGVHNVENALIAISAVEALGVDAEFFLPHLASFRGVERRFDVHYDSPHCAYIDDYAHHYDAIRATIATVRAMYPNRHLTGIFQPHLFSRLSVAFGEFADSLGALDRCILLPIYGAREEPIPGVTSERLLEMIPLGVEKMLVSPEDLSVTLSQLPFDVVLTMGAGSIGQLVSDIEGVVRQKDGLDA